MMPRPMPALVGDDHGGEAGAVEQADGVARKGVQLEQIEPIEVATLLDDRAVAIEKHRRPRQASTLRRGLSAASTSSAARCRHAAVIDRALTKHTGAAPDRSADHLGRAPRRASAARVACSSVGPNSATTASAGRGGQVHGAGIVRHAGARQAQHRRQHLQRRGAREIEHARLAVSRHRARESPRVRRHVAAAADQHACRSALIARDRSTRRTT